MNQDYQITACVQELTTTFIHQKVKNNSLYSRSDQKLSSLPPKAQSKRAKYLFPLPENSDTCSNFLYCDADRVLSIYNKENKTKRIKLTSVVQQWFINEALRCGWVHAEFIEHVQLNAKSCLLKKPSNKEVAYGSTH